MIPRTLAAALSVFAIPTYAALEGVATIHETDAAGEATIRGTLFFKQETALIDGKRQPVMKVTGELNGLPDGVHGFHIHQYGDESVDQTGKSRYGAHFVPVCQGIPDPNCNPMQGDCTPKVDKCKLLETHGLPPDEIRQAGDMGNIIVQAGQVTSLPRALKEVNDGIFKQEKMTLDDAASSILGRAVAIHKYEDIGREIPLYDGLCLKTCKVDLSAVDKSLQNGRSCTTNRGQVKLADLRIKEGINGIDTTEAKFENLRANQIFPKKNVYARFPSDDEKFSWFYYRVKQITSKPNTQDGNFEVEFDNDNACARRISAKYLDSSNAVQQQKPDAFGAAGPAIAGGVVGRMNPNADDGITPTGKTDNTKPADGATEISCFLRATEDAGANTIGGEVLIVQRIGTKQVDLQYKLNHGATMGGKDYSFHFHDYGDLRRVAPPNGDQRRVGKIYKEDSGDDIFTLKTLKIAGGAKQTYASDSYTLPDGLQGAADFVGRSLTIHSGPSKTSPTVSYGVCGLASPDSRQKFDTTTPVIYEPPEAEDAVSVVPSLVFLVASLLF